MELLNETVVTISINWYIHIQIKSEIKQGNRINK